MSNLSTNKMHVDCKNQPIFIHSGELVFGRGSRRIRTLLGSCVAITIRHPRLGLSGMCHYALPRSALAHTATDARYGEDCLELFRHAASRYGTYLHEYEARIFGGGNMLFDLRGIPSIEFENVDYSPVGEVNAACAFSMLVSEGIKILEADVGEDGYRKVEFDPLTGFATVEMAMSRRFA